MRLIENYAEYFGGKYKLPAGAIPLARINAGLVCILPSGRWMTWENGLIRFQPATIQKQVLDLLIPAIWGTAAGLAERLDMSARTIESWRSKKTPIPMKSAHKIANELAITSMCAEPPTPKP